MLILTLLIVKKSHNQYKNLFSILQLISFIPLFTFDKQNLQFFIVLRKLPKATVATAGTFDDKKTNYTISMSPFIGMGIDKYLSDNYRYIQADGVCLIPKNINDKDILAVDIYDPKSLNPKKGDILLIKYLHKGEEVLKLREFHSYDNKELIVIRYLPNGKPNKPYSSHKPDDILGKATLVHKGGVNWMRLNS